jgi:hypothetical protein
MSEKTKNATLIAIVMILSFAFGWTARGDVIYSGMFEQKSARMERLK